MVLVLTITLVTWVGSDAIACVGARRTSVMRDGCMATVTLGVTRYQSPSRKFGLLIVKVSWNWKGFLFSLLSEVLV